MDGDDETIVEVWTRNLGKPQLAQIQAQQKETSSSTMRRRGDNFFRWPANNPMKMNQ
jgi:hypothetical protein